MKAQSLIQTALVSLYLNTASASQTLLHEFEGMQSGHNGELSISASINTNVTSVSNARIPREEHSSFGNCFDDVEKCPQIPKRDCEFITPVADCIWPVNCFSSTCAWRFTELTYHTIKCLVLPKIDHRPICDPGMKYVKPKKCDIECEVYLLLLHVISTIPPSAFDLYWDAFHAERYLECFLILQRLCSPEAEIERLIIDMILCKNYAIRKRCPTCICFVDPCTKECSIVEFPKCNPKARICVFLPKLVLCFEEFLCTSFYLDELIIAELDCFTGCKFRAVFHYLLKNYYRCFRKLSYEARILFFLRIKFFAFNAIGYSISHLCSGPKNNVYKLLIDTAYSSNDVFFRSYAIGLGLLK